MNFNREQTLNLVTRNWKLIFNYIFVSLKDRPKLNLENNVECDSKKRVTLFCSLDVPDNFQTYGFGPWTMFVDGNYMTILMGTDIGKTSTLQIERCSYLSSGQYICSAYVQYRGTKYWTNESTALAVNSKLNNLKKYITAETARQRNYNHPSVGFQVL